MVYNALMSDQTPSGTIHPRRRTQAERTHQRKEQIIRAATHFFGQNGYHGARLADIAKAAGVTEPGLLHHFPTKAHLLMEVLAERDRIDQLRFDPSSRSATAGDHTTDQTDHEGTKASLAHLQKLVEYNQTVPGLVQLFTVLVAESIDEGHPGHEFFKQRYQTIRQHSLALLQEAQAQGEIRRDIPVEDLSILLFAMMDGLQVQWLYEPEKINMPHLFQQFLRFLN